MKIRFISMLALIFYVSITMAQSKLDAYKYIIVPERYDFLREVDQYRINSLTKFLFEKNGFSTLLEHEDYPDDVKSNPCLALTAEVMNSSSMFTSKLYIELKDCYKKVVFTSEVGRSKEKEYKISYQEALRNAFVTFEEMNYKFNPDMVVNKTITKKEPEVIVGTKVETVVPVVEVAPAIVVATKVDETPIKVEKEKDEKEKNLAKSYKNNNISFFLIEQNNTLVAYVKETKVDAYQIGEKIGTLFKTSRPNTYRITWKDTTGKSRETTGYFDEMGNLKIDIERDGNIQVSTFNVE